MTDTLDNPIWHALTTRQSAFALGSASSPARRFHPEIGPLAGIPDQSPASYAALAELFAPGEPAVLFLADEPQVPAHWQFLQHSILVQMTCPAPPPEFNSAITLRPLDAADVPAMLALTALTNPGPFKPRTIELGGFLGIHHEGELVAMAGQRLNPPGFTEISAVCTHPSARGRGYAQWLVAAVARAVQARGETPFLTSYEHNSSAIRVYESVGFAIRRRLHLAVLTPKA